MLSYRHAFHAGNHADILKHSTLSLLLQHLRQKDKPFVYMDTHAGAGLYDLGSDWAQKTGEAQQGIARIWTEQAAWPSLHAYFQSIAALQSDPGTARYYPGSPAIAGQLLRPQDALLLCELHRHEFQCLRHNMGQDKRVALHQRDGFEALGALLPPTPKRGLVLIDPPYEQRSDYQAVSRSLHKALQRWATGQYMVWYPCLAKQRDASQTLLTALQNLPCRSLLRVELTVREQAPELGMHGSGLAIINAPWQLDKQLEAILPRLCQTLKVTDAATWRVEWLRQAS